MAALEHVIRMTMFPVDILQEHKQPRHLQTKRPSLFASLNAQLKERQVARERLEILVEDRLAPEEKERTELHLADPDEKLFYRMYVFAKIDPQIIAEAYEMTGDQVRAVIIKAAKRLRGMKARSTSA